MNLNFLNVFFYSFQKSITSEWCAAVFINILLQGFSQRFLLKPTSSHDGVTCTRSSNKKRCIYIYNFTIPDLTQRNRQAMITTPLIVSSEGRDVCILNVITAKGAYFDYDVMVIVSCYFMFWVCELLV